MFIDKAIVDLVSETVIRAGSSCSGDKKTAYRNAIEAERNECAKWALENIYDNIMAAEKNASPLCDDTGIPHLLLEIGPNEVITGNMLESIKEGVRQGLRRLPGRPMAVKGDDYRRIDQSLGLYEDSGAVEAAPFMLRYTHEDVLRLYVLMFGGGPAIRAKTYRIFHQHSTQMVLDEIVSWAKEETSLLGCTPCTLGIGIGRSHYEASALMVQALVDGKYGIQNEMEREITERVNQSGTGALGLGGGATVLATFMKVGPQRASGVRIVCVRPCCCFEPRIAAVDLKNIESCGD